MKRFNLTEWALTHKQLMYYFIFVTLAAGIFSYQSLGRMEDPDFTVRQMLVSVNWPGATARQVEEQVTDKLEKKLQDTPGLDYVKSYSKPGQAIIYVVLKDDKVTDAQVRPTWLEVRNMVNDIKMTLPAGVDGPYFNDRFDDVFGSIYALTGDGYSYEDLREQAEIIRRTLLGVPSVKKADLLGVQPERIFIEIDAVKLARLGLSPTAITSAIQSQNSMAAAGMLETSSDNVYLRISGMFESIEALKEVPIRAGDNTFRLGDIATIERSYANPPEPKMYYNGQPAVGLAVSMEKGGNILTLGDNLTQIIARTQKNLPLGLDLSAVANQPQVVKESINEFVRLLTEAVIIVLAINFISLGLRSGIVVALCIPLVIAGTFATMNILGIDLHKVSLGALIISLGLLVDDAIIAIEMMTVKLEQGWNHFNAACFAYTSTAFPMLTGTLVTCAGFIPVGFSKGSASEFLGSLFSVILISLVISWFVSVLVTPLLGYKLLKIKATAAPEQDLYSSGFYQSFRKLLAWCLQHRRLVLGITFICFLGSIFLLQFTKKEFFPASDRPELIVDLRLPEGASFKATELEAARFAQLLSGDPQIVNYTYYVGQGAPRFVLSAEPILPAANFSQFVIVAKDVSARNEVLQKTRERLAAEFPGVKGNFRFVQTGPSSQYPVMLRVSGPEHDQVRKIAAQARDIMAASPDLKDINFDWNEKSKVMQLVVDQDKARVLGIDNQSLSASLQALLSGAAISQFREDDKTVNIIFRVSAQDRDDLSRIKDLNIHIGNGQFIPVGQIAKISYTAEEGLIWRRDLKPTITVQANTRDGVLGNDAASAAYASLKDLRTALPSGYSITPGGPMEMSQKATRWLLQPVPAMIIFIVTLLMFQLQSIPKMLLALLTAPLGIIGVSAGLMMTGSPLGFVVQLGILALFGIIIRNAVILLDQIERHSQAGEALWDAIINATVSRFRPIILTAAAAILGMLPLISSIFWGPMAVAIASGLLVATILTLLVVPTMYAAWFKAHPRE